MEKSKSTIKENSACESDCMHDTKPVASEKIILPKNLQREMIKFFMQATFERKAKENAEDGEHQTPLNTPAEEC